MTNSHQLTESGVAELEAELDKLKQRRVDVAERLKAAKALGDLSENADYTVALEEQEYVESRISEISDILHNVEIIKSPKNKSKVELGNTVTLESDGKELSYTVVGSLESDPGAGKISQESPIGKALLGAKKGDTVEISTPGGARECTVKEIS